MTKNDIMAKLDLLEIKYNTQDKKEVLEAQLTAVTEINAEAAEQSEDNVDEPSTGFKFKEQEPERGSGLTNGGFNVTDEKAKQNAITLAVEPSPVSVEEKAEEPVAPKIVIKTMEAPRPVDVIRKINDVIADLNALHPVGHLAQIGPLKQIARNIKHRYKVK